MVARQGFEPRLNEPKSLVLPLHHRAPLGKTLQEIESRNLAQANYPVKLAPFASLSALEIHLQSALAQPIAFRLLFPGKLALLQEAE